MQDVNLSSATFDPSQPCTSNSPASSTPTASRSLLWAISGAWPCPEGAALLQPGNTLKLIQDAAGEEISTPCSLCRHSLSLFVKQSTSSTVKVRRKCIFWQSRSLPELLLGLREARPCLFERGSRAQEARCPKQSPVPGRAAPEPLPARCTPAQPLPLW